MDAGRRLSRAGFTGTRNGMTPQQRDTLLGFILAYQPAEFHHGDCVGADQQACAALDAAEEQGNFYTWRVVHPPVHDSERAFAGGDVIRKPRPYLARNRDIVNDTNYLIAAPATMHELDYGGTWFTVRYARWVLRPVCIVWPNGTVKWERSG